MTLALLSLLITVPQTSAAQEIRVSLDERAKRLLGAKSAVVEERLESEFAQQKQALIGEVDLGELLDLSATSQALVQKGLGTDYASGADGLILGASGGAAIDPGRPAIAELEDVPAGAQLTLMIGYNFAALGVPDLTVFIHGLGAPISLSKLDGSFYNFGAGVQYRVLGPYGSKMLEWGGLSLTTGVEVSRMSVRIADVGDLDFDMTVQGVRLQGDSTGSLRLVQHAVSIPLELTTSITALYFLSLYAGVGADIDFGGANLIFDVDTQVTAAGRTGEGSAQALLEDEGRPDRLAFRVLGGAQVNLGPVHLFGQINVLPKDLILGVSAGARVAF